MKKFNLQEEEVQRILGMHKREMNEQIENSTKVEDPSLTIISNAVKLGCLSKGQRYLDKTNNKYYYRKPSAKETEVGSNGKPTPKLVDFFSDMTYKFVDGSKAGNWKCDDLVSLNTTNTDVEREITQNQYKKREDIPVTDTELAQLYEKHPKYDLYRIKIKTNKVSGFTEDQQAFIDQFKQKKADGGESGYVETLTPQQRALGTYQAVKVSGTEQLFPNGCLIMYRPAAGEQDKKLCRDKVKKYYEYWKTKREDIPQNEFDSLKSQVQACANQHEGKWGGIFSVVDNQIKTLRGGTGGPLSDSKWRLK